LVSRLCICARSEDPEQHGEHYEPLPQTDTPPLHIHTDSSFAHSLPTKFCHSKGPHPNGALLLVQCGGMSCLQPRKKRRCVAPPSRLSPVFRATYALVGKATVAVPITQRSPSSFSIQMSHSAV